MKSLVLFLVLSSSALAGLKTCLSQAALYEYFFTGLLSLEIISRISKLGVKRFFSSGLNIFDFTVTMFSLFFSAFAIFRLLTLLPGLNKITQMIIRSVPSVGYVSLLLSIHTYFYSIIGVLIFSKNDPEHFGSIVLALISLFQVITLEGWADLLNFEMQNFPIAAPLYFISFVIVGTILILNVLVSVMTNAFVEATIETEMSSLKESQSASFKAISGELKAISRELKVRPKLEVIVGGAVGNK